MVCAECGECMNAHASAYVREYIRVGACVAFCLCLYLREFMTACMSLHSVNEDYTEMCCICVKCEGGCSLTVD